VSDESSDDRRRAERIPINEEFSSDGSTWVSDLSVGGVFVHTEELVPIGIAVELRFTVLLDDPLVIDAVGKVVRHSRRPVGIGVQFSALAPEMRERIEHVLARQRPLDSGTPIRLPEPSHVRDDVDGRVSWARPAPTGELLLPVDDDDEQTSSFPRIPISEPATIVFRPPPLPGKRPVDEDARTSQFPAMRRKED
jgi:Tfp pilus assembly protein PilZ